MKIEIAALTDVGLHRKNNEDSFGYDLAAQVFVVCDGMGGMAAGETASGTAVKELLEFFSQAQADTRRSERLREAILHANRQVYALAEQHEELRGMGTTLVAACVDDGSVFIGNVGDSRAYFLRNGVCAQITHDHSFVAEQVRHGLMNEEEAGASPLKSLITRAIGQAETVEPDIFTAPVEPGDILLLTSDGLTRYADEQMIASRILSCSDLGQACHGLIETAKEFGAVDNVTCLLVQFLPETDTSSGQ